MTNPNPPANPHPERGPLWVERSNEMGEFHLLHTGTTSVPVTTNAAEIIERQLGQSQDPPRFTATVALDCVDVHDRKCESVSTVLSPNNEAAEALAAQINGAPATPIFGAEAMSTQVIENQSAHIARLEAEVERLNRRQTGRTMWTEAYENLLDDRDAKNTRIASLETGEAAANKCIEEQLAEIVAQQARIAELEAENADLHRACKNMNDKCDTALSKVERLTQSRDYWFRQRPIPAVDDLPDGVTMQPTATGQWLIDNDPDGNEWERTVHSDLWWANHAAWAEIEATYVIRRRTPAPDVGTERITITIDKQTAVELTTGSSIVMDRAYLDLVDAATKALDGEV